jgi:catechol 2,3-dioxygenase-like lactoylglutathione lyase family enzyme
MEVVGFDHVQLAAPRGCEDDARRFFGGLLGLTEVEKPEPLDGRGGVWFAVGGRQLHVGVDYGHRPALKAHPALAVRGLDVLAGRLEAAGVRVEWDSSLPGVRRFYAADPWGNRIELVEAG